MLDSIKGRIKGFSKRTIYETITFGVLVIIIIVTNFSGNITKIRNAFVDINQDGKIDYILKADVILNVNGSFPKSQEP